MIVAYASLFVLLLLFPGAVRASFARLSAILAWCVLSPFSLACFALSRFSAAWKRRWQRITRPPSKAVTARDMHGFDLRKGKTLSLSLPVFGCYSYPPLMHDGIMLWSRSYMLHTARVDP